MDDSENERLLEQQPVMAWQLLLLLLLAVAVGALAAAVLLPAWAPDLVASLLGPKPMAYWFLSRASALVAYVLLWLSMASGLIISNRLARLWPGGPTAFDLHQHTSLLGLAFAMFHALILLGDKYIGYSLGQVLVPFASVAYRPVWVGLGQIAFYLLVAVTLSFYVVRQIGYRSWRLIHFLSFVVFLLALVHGLASGTDSATPSTLLMYWASGGSLLLLSTYRVLAHVYGVA
jgi:predicted ferric reductase